MKHEPLIKTNIVENALSANAEEIEKSLRDAVLNARLIGIGFVAITRAKRGDHYRVTSMMWHEVEDALKSIGVRNGRGNPHG